MRTLAPRLELINIARIQRIFRFVRSIWILNICRTLAKFQGALPKWSLIIHIQPHDLLLVDHGFVVGRKTDAIVIEFDIT